MWKLYILKCADETFYTGVTNDIEKRLRAHNLGRGAKYTRGRSPVKLIYKESCSSKSAALKREMEIKKYSRAKKESIISSKNE